MEDFEAVNKMAMDQISRLDGTKKVEVPTALPPGSSTQRGSLWGGDYVNKYRPSEQSTPASSYAPRTYYSSPSYGNTNNNSMDAIYRKTLSAVYRSAPTQEQQAPAPAVVMPPATSLALWGMMASTPPDAKQAPQIEPLITRDTQKQIWAIVWSGFAKIFTTVVANYARNNHVPYELM